MFLTDNDRPKMASEQTCKALKFSGEAYPQTLYILLQKLSQPICPCYTLSCSESRLQHCDRLKRFVVRGSAVLNQRPNKGVLKCHVWILTNINTNISKCLVWVLLT